ncbi:MAG: hypothetical protein JXA96_17285 [Sedimentisphaerales bacterium]|nr:hypothetical protein [Sedimentisphaerales bacterium]
MKLTLNQFILEHQLNPEGGGKGIEWFRPQEMFFVETKKIDKTTELHIFASKADTTRCGIIDTATTSILLGEDDLDEELKELEETEQIS